jgi:hypothetical protein
MMRTKCWLLIALLITIVSAPMAVADVGQPEGFTPYPANWTPADLQGPDIGDLGAIVGRASEGIEVALASSAGLTETLLKRLEGPTGQGGPPSIDFEPSQGGTQYVGGGNEPSVSLETLREAVEQTRLRIGSLGEPSLGAPSLSLPDLGVSFPWNIDLYAQPVGTQGTPSN